MKVVTYRITLLEPTLVTALEGDPNSAVSYNYLPGSVLRGMFIGFEMRQNHGKELAITDDDVRRRFFSNNTRFLNGYLVVNNGVENERSLPTPRTWDKPKYPDPKVTEIKITDRALADEPQDKEKSETQQAEGQKAAGEGQGKTKNQGGKFVVFTKPGEEVKITEPERVINIHTMRNREKGRSFNAAKSGQATTGTNTNQQSENNGAIYRYEALAARQTFEARILCETDTDAEEDAKYFEALLKQYPRGVIGGARTAGYGRVQIQVINEEREELPKTNRKTVDVLDKNKKPQQFLAITLLSDVILRDANGQYSPDAETLHFTLTKALKKDAQEPIALPDFARVFKGETTIGGFNRKWGLPLPQVQALEMGSVFVIDVTNLDTDKQKLLDALVSLEQQGIGERRNEGFGRIAVGWQQNPTLKEFKQESQPENSTEKKNIAANLAGESQKVGQLMDNRIKRQITDREQLAKANELGFAGLPPTSQLNRLRQVVNTALLQLTATPNAYTEANGNKDENVIEKFFKEIDGKRAGKLFEAARIKSQKAADGKFKEVQKMQDWLDAQMKMSDKYAALRLVDAMLARAVKENNNG